MHLSLMFDARARTGPGSRTRGKTPSKSTIARIRRAQKKLAELGEVDVLTAGDNYVCPVCEEISEDGPYDLDTAEDLIPAHPFCRCAFVPAGTLTDYNPYHVPAGSPEGGQFTSGEGVGTGSAGGGIESLVHISADPPFDPKVVDVGGDEWNRQTALRLEREYQNAKPALEKIANEAVGGKPESTTKATTPYYQWQVVQTTGAKGFFLQNEQGVIGAKEFATEEEAQSVIEQYKKQDELSKEEDQPEEDDESEYIPESWDEINDTKQEEIKNDWMEKTADQFLADEINSWQENGDAMDDTKAQLAYNLDGHKGNADNQYAFDALNEMRDERKEDGVEEIPFTNEQLMDAMSFDYEGGYGGAGDVKITWNYDKLGLPKGWVSEQGTLPGIEPLQPSSKLTKEMHEDIEATLKKAFNDEAENKVGDAEPPEYLKDNVGEYQDQYWDGMLNKEKFKWAQQNGYIEEPEEEEQKQITLNKMPDKIDPLGENDKSRDYQLTKMLAEKISVGRAADVMMQRGVFKDRNIALRAAHDFDNRLWRSWKGDSASADGLLLQAATADELGGRFRSPSFRSPKVFEFGGEGEYMIAGTGAGSDLSSKVFASKNEAEKALEGWLKTSGVGNILSASFYKDSADQRFGSAGGWDGMKAYIRAKWETSQYLLDKADKPEVDVYRGILIRDKGREEPVETKRRDYALNFHFTKLPDFPLHRSGAQSATTDIRVANEWKGVGAAAKGLTTNDRVVLRMRVPRTAVLSLPAYGQNVYGEHEVVLAGTAWKKWDAWHGHAPDFSEESI